MKFKVNDPVLKPSGYRFVGYVVAAFTTTAGKERYVVENGDTMLHIFNEGQLEYDDSRTPFGEASPH